MLTLRRATPADAGALALLGAATFLESYCLDLDGADIVAHCAQAHAVAFYDAALQDPEAALWVAEARTTAVGYAMLAPSVLPEAHQGDLELRRVYVLRRFQGGGTGRRLVAAAAEEARARGARRLTLGMYGENHAALAFYRRVGFEIVGTRTFTVGARMCDDLVLAREL